MARAPRRRSDCPISIALDVLGDPWALLVIRDLMFKGLSTFNEFQTAGEGIASNILADRLARLDAAGIVTRRQDERDARRVRYALTEKGVDLAPVLVELVLWSDRYEDTAAPPHVVQQMRTNRSAVIAEVKAHWAHAVAAAGGSPRQTPAPQRSRRP